MLNYATNIEPALATATKHAAIKPTTKNNLPTCLDTQQRLFIKQTSKFMTMLKGTATNTGTQQPTATNTGTQQPNPPAADHIKWHGALMDSSSLGLKPAMELRFCNSYKKHGTFHAYDDRCSLEETCSKCQVCCKSVGYDGTFSNLE